MSKASNSFDSFLAGSIITVLAIVASITAVVLIWFMQT